MNTEIKTTEDEEKKKKKRKKFFIWFFALLGSISVATGGVVAGLLLSQPQHPTVLELTVSAYKVNNSQETKLFENEFVYNEINFNSSQNATAINEAISAQTSIKLLYDIKNISQEKYVYRVDFSSIDKENCDVFYKVNNSEQTELTTPVIEITDVLDGQIEISLKVANPSLNSHFIGYISIYISY